MRTLPFVALLVPTAIVSGFGCSATHETDLPGFDAGVGVDANDSDATLNSDLGPDAARPVVVDVVDIQTETAYALSFFEDDLVYVSANEVRMARIDGTEAPRTIGTLPEGEIGSRTLAVPNYVFVLTQEYNADRFTGRVRNIWMNGTGMNLLAELPDLRDGDSDDALANEGGAALVYALGDGTVRRMNAALGGDRALGTPIPAVDALAVHAGRVWYAGFQTAPMLFRRDALSDPSIDATSTFTFPARVGRLVPGEDSLFALTEEYDGNVVWVIDNETGSAERTPVMNTLSEIPRTMGLVRDEYVLIAYPNDRGTTLSAVATGETMAYDEALTMIELVTKPSGAVCWTHVHGLRCGRVAVD